MDCLQVIWENKDRFPNGVPHLVYVAREKRPKQSHHFKAGAMNVLVSWISLGSNRGNPETKLDPNETPTRLEL